MSGDPAVVVAGTVAAGLATRVVFEAGKRLMAKVRLTRPDFVLGYVDHNGTLVLAVSNQHGGDGKQAQCVMTGDGSHAYGVARNDLITAGESFDVITPFSHGPGPYGVISACNVSQRVQFFWRVEKDRQRRRLKRRTPEAFRDHLTGPQALMQRTHGLDRIGESIGTCRFVEDRSANPWVDR